METNKIKLVLTTVPNEELALHIAHELVERKLAACCNIIPSIRSVYCWQGKMQEDPEVLMIIKTASSEYSKLETCIIELHPYETPEIIAIEITQGFDKYLAWVLSETSPCP